MKLNSIHVLAIVIVLLGAPVAGAQESPTQPLFAGELPSLALEGEREPANMIVGTLRFEGAYDDNAFSTNGNKEGAFTWIARPRLDLLHYTPRLNLNLYYSPGYSGNEVISDENFWSHSAGGEVRYQASPRLRFRLRDSFSYSTNIVSGIQQQNAPDFNVLDTPNEGLVTPIAKRFSHTATAETNYEVGRHSEIGFSGNFSQLRYSQVTGDAVGDSLIDTRTLGARAWYQSKISRRHSIGAMYEVQELSFEEDAARTLTHAIFYTHSIEVGPSQTITFFGGPERISVSDQVTLDFGLFQILIPIHRTDWSGAGGVTYGWRGKRTSVRASFIRRVTDGGGLVGAVRQHGVSAQLRHRFAPRWTGTAVFRFSDNSVLGTASRSALQSVTGGGGIEYRLTRDANLQFGYARVHQDTTGAFVYPVGDHNRVTFAIEYQFKQPWGS